MGNSFRCPGCEHFHPNGIGATVCGCNDCYLLSGQILVGFMGETASKRYAQLREWMREEGLRAGDDDSALLAANGEDV